MTNVCRHSKSEKVSVRLGQRKGYVRVEVRDWGVGFEPAAVRGPHHGLPGIRSRARMLGGRAVVRSAPGKGTRILVELPLVAATSESGPAREPPPKPPP
jgi:signal transduction histidine kinase